MNCPKCKTGRTRVVDSRQSLDGSFVRRRRECHECEHRYSTWEYYEERVYVFRKSIDLAKQLWEELKKESGQTGDASESPPTELLQAKDVKGFVGKTLKGMSE